MNEQFEFSLPDVGEGIAEAEIVEWHVAVGDEVREDAPLVTVETDKSLVELPSPVAGTITTLHAEEGVVVQVGSPIVTVQIAEGATAPAVEHAPIAAGVPDSVPVPDVPLATATHVLASPYTRRLAVQRGIDLAEVTGSGPHGRVLASDLDDHVSGKTRPDASGPVRSDRPAPARSHDDEIVPVRGLRRQIARSMTEALAIPHVTEFKEVDATALLRARAALKPHFEARGQKLSVLPFLLRAVTRALLLQPSINATYDADREELTRYAGVHLGVATATDDGLIVPVIRDADQLGIQGLTEAVDRLADRARTRTATLDELTGGSFTVTNFGSFGTWLGTPVIRPPEVGIAGFGRIAEKVVAVDGQAVVRPMLPIAVAVDHRINDGADLGQFVAAVAEAIVEPLLLLG
ncbi:dihydrolipoamide acetyltransferase family protein [Aeromicrobium sp. P5_D10]